MKLAKMMIARTNQRVPLTIVSPLLFFSAGDPQLSLAIRYPPNGQVILGQTGQGLVVAEEAIVIAAVRL
jgi:hypothetical protein